MIIINASGSATLNFYHTHPKFGCHRAFLRNLTPGWPRMTPCVDLWSQDCIAVGQGFFLPSFRDHRAFLMQIDLWMTFELWSGRFKKFTMNLGGPCPATLPSFSSMCWSNMKRIAGQTDWQSCCCCCCCCCFCCCCCCFFFVCLFVFFFF